MMKSLFQYLLFGLIGAMLVGCSSTWIHQRDEVETIDALVFTKESLYILGQKNDFVFKKEKIDKGSFPFGVAEFEQFLQSPIKNKITNSELDIKVVDEKQVNLSYRIYFKPELTEDENNWLRQHNMYAVQRNYMWFWVKGQRIQVQNHAALLNQYRLQKPVQFPVRFYQSKMQWDSANAKDVGGVLLSPVLLPAVMVIWGAACLPTIMGNGDGC